MAMVSSGTLSINAAFLQEIKEDNRLLRDLLERAFGLCTDPRFQRVHPRRLVELFRELQDQLAMHFALEEAFGYFDDAIDVAPHLSQTACNLRSQHAEFFVQICDMVDMAEQLLYGETSTHVLWSFSSRFTSFYDQLHQHEACENELICQALDDDIGVGD
jgi:hypothetical protein